MSDPMKGTPPATYEEIRQAIEDGHAGLITKSAAYRQSAGAVTDAASQVSTQRRTLADLEAGQAAAAQAADAAKAELANALRDQGDRQHRAANLLDPPAPEAPAV